MNLNFRLKTILGIASIALVLMSALTLSAYVWIHQTNERQFNDGVALTSQLISRAAKDAIIATDIATLQDLVQETLRSSGVVYVQMVGMGQVLAYGGQASEQLSNRTADTSLDGVDDGVYDLILPIAEGDFSFGEIRLGLSTLEIESSFDNANRWIFSLAALELLLVVVFSAILGTFLTRQLSVLKQAANNIMRHGPGYQVSVKGNDEIASVAQAMNRMSSGLNKSYKDLEKSLEEEMEARKLAMRAQTKNDAILSSSLDGIITIDAGGRVLEFNKVAEHTFGWHAEEILGHSLADFIVPTELRERHRAGMIHYALTGEGPVLGKRIELPALHKNGQQFPIEISIFPIKTDESHLFTAFVRDLSEQKKYEANLQQARKDAEQANEAKSRFLATMSHEIRTPMNVILGFLGLLRESNLDAEQKKMVQMARDSGNHLLALINDVLDFSKMEANKLILEESEFDPYRLIEQVTELMRVQAERKNLRLLSQLDSRLSHLLIGDADRIRQILINLISNAIKFTDKGYVETRILLEHEEGESVRVKFTVEDTGIGIAPHYRKTLFDEFTMADQTESRVQEGTGLGLAICKRLVDLMGGSIDVKSQVREGSQFSFSIPLKKAKAQVPPEPLQVLNHDRAWPHAGTRILLA
ncbi:MAG: ATP-binding protein, partial [Limnobacter sp.]|nr:ATP-binding protein [Limnobacter sp.]